MMAGLIAIRYLFDLTPTRLLISLCPSQSQTGSISLSQSYLLEQRTVGF